MAAPSPSDLSACAVPEIVADAYERAEASGFELSCDPQVGAHLSALAAASPNGARVVELGSGVGVILAVRPWNRHRSSGDGLAQLRSTKD